MPEAAVSLMIDGRERDLGDGFTVRRILPVARRRSVGPFVFLDQIGPARIPAGEGLDVRPHPHIGLATITYLFEGVITHRDSLGVEIDIRPGELNWMVAGAGVVHSERSPAADRAVDSSLWGMQAWVALPQDQEEVAPSFAHYEGSQIERWMEGDAEVTLIAGSAFGRTSPVVCNSPTLYLAVHLPAGSCLPVPDATERAVYCVAGSLSVNGTPLAAGQMAVLEPGEAMVAAAGDSRVMILGGDPLDGPRTIWWNFVSSRPQRIEQAKADWKSGLFAGVPGETEFIPLPE